MPHRAPTRVTCRPQAYVHASGEPTRRTSSAYTASQRTWQSPVPAGGFRSGIDRLAAGHLGTPSPDATFSGGGLPPWNGRTQYEAGTSGPATRPPAAPRAPHAATPRRDRHRRPCARRADGPPASDTAARSSSTPRSSASRASSPAPPARPELPAVEQRRSGRADVQRQPHRIPRGPRSLVHRTPPSASTADSPQDICRPARHRQAASTRCAGPVPAPRPAAASRPHRRRLRRRECIHPCRR